MPCLTRKAFTLIELLVVIAIVSIVSITVVVVLNPSEILKKSRDANRISNLSTLKTALQTYISGLGGVLGTSLGSVNVTYVSIPDPTATSTAGTDCSGVGYPFTGGCSFHCPASSTFRNNNGTGWIPVNLSAFSYGSPPLSLPPVAPVNTTSSNEYYTYQTDGSTYKLRATPESQTYLNQAGPNPYMFMMGSNLNLGGGQHWVVVPKDTRFGTQNFWVMKYTAVCSQNGQALGTVSFGSAGRAVLGVASL